MSIDLHRDVLATHPVFDGHNDLAWELRERFASDPRAAGLLDQPILHTDVPRLRAGGVGAQFWSVYVPSDQDPAAATVAVLEQIDVVRRLVATHPDVLAWTPTAPDVREALAAGRIASLVGAEGGHSIAGSLGVLRELRRAGLAYLTLTHHDNTPWAASATGEPVDHGLTGFGRDVVREMNRTGVLVDLSHVHERTMHDALDVTTRPVLFSHSSCRAVTDHPRNVPDAVLERLPGNGGVLMVTFVPAFVAAPGADRATLHDVVRHLEHAREVVGIEHVGLGGDYDGTDAFPDGLGDVSRYPALLQALADRGWSAADLRALTCGNALRVLAEAQDGTSVD
ncbi:dipeptidase [Kineococcus sp. LSe6-4]|uniref:Dipeptidase n=1 Tax=Kineococcus halophytocola TaxID=3234027 RepID=A0ABV4GZC7_9ACTN